MKLCITSRGKTLESRVDRFGRAPYFLRSKGTEHVLSGLDIEVRKTDLNTLEEMRGSGT